MFYRIEHTEYGLGPFFALSIRPSLTARRAFRELALRHVAFPTPSMERLSRALNNCTWYCGYKTKNLMLQYVGIDLLTILVKELHFKIYAIKATSTQCGKYQVIFTKESIISKIDVTSEFIN